MSDKAKQEYYAKIGEAVISVIDRMQDLTSKEEAVKLCHELVNRTEPIFSENYEELMAVVKGDRYHLKHPEDINREINMIFGLSPRFQMIRLNKLVKADEVFLNGNFTKDQLAALATLLRRVDPSKPMWGNDV